jgi:hypothetical protein
LPRVDRFQLWAEPNLALYLSPQWKHGKPVGATHYRTMLNAFYAGVKSSNPGALVLTGGTAPYGDPGHSGKRMQPVTFWRALVSQKVSFDVAAVNPINVGAPTRHALNKEDISTPDIARLRKVLRKGRRHIQPGGAPIWATEIWWDSRPPDPHGIAVRKHARWLAQSFYVLWKQGVSSVVWFQIQDQAANPDLASTFQTGLFFANGEPKPAYDAYRFPFVGDRLGKATVRVWGEAPGAGGVEVQRKRGGGWKTIKRLNAGTNRVFTGNIRLRGGAKLRARSGGETSLVWNQGA